MPIYEYKCKDCGDDFEELILGRDKEPEKCPKCESKNISRKVSNTSFMLTGKGWYVTDYGGYNPGAVPAEKEEKSAQKEDSGGSDSTSSDSSTTESKGKSEASDS